MVTVDSKGRIVLPQEIRERLGIQPGTEVEVREVDGCAFVKPEDDPERIIEDIERRIEQAASHREREPTDDPDAIARDHRQTIQRQAREASENDA